MEYLLMIVYGLWWGFLRRWYGGCFGKYPFLRNRGVQTIVMILSLFLLFCSFRSLHGAAASLLLACYLQFQFWSRGHGACFDIGRGTPDETTIKRYNERWYHKPLDWWFSKMDANEHKYGFLYDFLYMGMRYTCPMVALYFLSPVFVLIGALISPVYAFNWTLFEKESWIFSYKIPKFCRAPTQISEIVVGFVFGCGLYYIAKIAN